MNKVLAGFSLLRHLGPGWVAFRIRHAIRRKSGALRRATPAVPWRDLPAPALALRPLTAARFAGLESSSPLLQEAEGILRGRFTLFSHRQAEAGFPPDWSRNWLTEEGSPGPANRGPERIASRHWSEITDAGAQDIKGVWELSRFPWAFTLARAFARTQEVRFADGFWALFADWCGRNAPNVGPNWMCGQEATFRLMAATFAAELCGVPADRRDAFARFVVATGRRIEGHLGYALSQKNNHGVSECVGLITAALLLPDYAESIRWLDRGRRELERQCAELIYDDGGFAQHSIVYHRVLLHDLCWVRRRLTLAGMEIPGWLTEAGRRATTFFAKLVDPRTGGAPLYGANDGANILPLADAGFLDFRPALQLAAASFAPGLALPSGPWDEAATWLVPEWDRRLERAGGDPPAPVRAPGIAQAPGPAWHASTSGIFQLTERGDRLFFRCPERFRHRPSQADLLHVDVWHDGQAVAMDGGTYSYNSRARFTHLKDGAQHNAVTIAGREMMTKFSRFLYLPWPRGRAAATSDGWFEAGCDGYEKKLGVQWTRAVRSRGTGFEVRDRFRGSAPGASRLHWRLVDAEWRIDPDRRGVSATLAGRRVRIGWEQGGPPVDLRLVRADPDSAYGWWSPHYGEVEPAVSLLLDLDLGCPSEIITAFEFPAA